MDLRRVANIIKIAEEKNITRAADKLFISQPALNLQLLNLEKELGCKLFFRRGNQWSITEAGMIYVETGRKMLAMKKDAYSRISDVANLRNEEITIGTSGLHGDEMMTRIYSEFHKTNPGVKIQLNIMKGIKTQELVKNGTIDLGVILMDNDKKYKLEYELLSEIELVLAISEQNENLKYVKKDENGEDIIDLADLEKQPFILYAKDSTERYIVEDVFQEAGIVPDIYMYVEGRNYQFELVRKNECCSIVGENSFKHIPEGIRLVKIKSHPKMNAVAVYRNEKYLSEPMKNLIEILKDYWAGEL